MAPRKTNRRYLTEDEAAAALLAMLRDGESAAEVAARYGQHATSMVALKRGRRFAHVLPDLPRTAPEKPGRKPGPQPREHGNKLAADQVAQIIERTRKGERHATIARAFNVHPDTISRICRRERWPHVLPDEPRGTSRRARLKLPE